MTSIRRFEYSNDKQITAQKVDELSDFLWVAFAQNNDGNCIIEKESKFFPVQTYVSLERSVSNVNQMDLDSSFVYVAYEDDILLGEVISKNNPLTVTTEILKEAFVESPVDVLASGTDLWLLLPGNASGINAKLLRYTTSGVFQQEVDLNKSGGFVVNNAKSMTIDGNGDIWIATYTTPATIVRVFQISGGLYDFDIDSTLIA